MTGLLGRLLRRLRRPLSVLGVAFCLIEPALANKFKTIGGGVAGMSREKIELLRMIGLYLGGFLLLLSLLLLVTRKRFEGMAGYGRRGGAAEIAMKGAAVLAVIGALLVGQGLL